MVDPNMEAKSKVPFELRMAKVLGDPLRIKIVQEAYTREISPKMFLDEFGGGSMTRVFRHFDALIEYDWLVLANTKSGGKRRGGVEHFYRATRPVLFDSDTWPSLPDALKDLFTWKVFETYAERVTEAVKAGTIDARDDRHFSWTPLLYDQQGWDAVIPRVDALFEFLFEEEARAALRMAESGEEPIPITVGLGMFESPKDSTKAP